MKTVPIKSGQECDTTDDAMKICRRPNKKIKQLFIQTFNANDF